MSATLLKGPPATTGIRTACLAVVLGLVAGAAHAGKAKAQPGDDAAPYRNKPLVKGAAIWHCWYAGDSNIYCRLDEAGLPTARAPEPLAPQLPQVVDSILNAPGSLAGRVVRIPMHAPPFAHDMVGELAASVMCGTKRPEACGVVYAENSRQLAAMVGERKLAAAEGEVGAQMAMAD